MIEVENLAKDYGATRALHGISFRVESGDILGFLGPNGAGKSTTMRILTGYTPPTSGDARVAGFDVRRESMAARAAIGYLPENTPLYLDMTVRGYLGFMAELKGVESRKRRAAIDLALEETRLTQVAERIVGNLSKGYRQRVGLAQALVGDPKVLILDEPTVGLDPSQNRELRTLISGMRGRRTVLISTHILPEVSATCNKVAILHKGRIEFSGSLDNLMGAVAGGGGEVRAIAGGDAEPMLRALRALPGIATVREAETDALGRHEFSILLQAADGAGGGGDVRPAIARAILDAGGQLFELRGRGATLEDVFIGIVSREARHDDVAAGAGA